MKKIAITTIAAMALTLPAIGSADAIEAAETIRVPTIERGASNKPPFKRRWTEVAVTDVAAADTVAMTETVTLKTVTRGPNRKPPFKRETVTVPVVDTAMSEETAPRQLQPKLPGKPPFKRHR